MRFRLCFVLVLAGPVAGAEKPVDFNRDIRPILYNNCIACHGPDGDARKADLRLDTEAGALAAVDGHAAIVKGKPEDSELVKRMTSSVPSEKMPPAKSGGIIFSRRTGAAPAPDGIGRARARIPGFATVRSGRTRRLSA